MTQSRPQAQSTDETSDDEADRPLGPWPLAILRAAQKLPPAERYIGRIEQFLAEEFSDTYSIELAQVHVTLRRLADKKLVAMKPKALVARNGHKVTQYTVTESGTRIAERSAKFYYRLSDVIRL